MEKTDKAIEHIKRIIIWNSTDNKIKDLYNELIKLNPKDEEIEEVKWCIILEKIPPGKDHWAIQR